MNKKSFYCSFLFFIIALYNLNGQSFIKKNEGIWISDDHCVMFIDSKNSSIYNPIGEYKDNLKMHFRKVDSVIRLIDNFKSYDYNFDLKPREEIAFRLLEMDCYNLKLLPDNELTIKFLNTTDTISFSRTKKVNDENIEFEKLLFFGQEDFFNYYINIDNERNFKMIKKNNRRVQNAGTFFFYGEIEEYFFTLLIDKIKESNLKI